MIMFNASYIKLISWNITSAGLHKTIYSWKIELLFELDEDTFQIHENLTGYIGARGKKDKIGSFGATAFLEYFCIAHSTYVSITLPLPKQTTHSGSHQ
jgi:hypothetical protein